jgi:hypothetical protein
MSLSNLLSNTYNVPLWAKAQIQYYWHQQPPQQQHAAVHGAQAVPGVHPFADVPAGNAAVAPVPAATLPPPHAAAAAPATADVPDEVIPLTPKADAEESTAVLVGTDDRYGVWKIIIILLGPLLTE